MEGGSPSLIWQRWTLPMLYAQRRYWGDHPRLDQLEAAKLKLKPKYTPPPRPADAGDMTPARPLDWSLLDT